MEHHATPQTRETVMTSRITRGYKLRALPTEDQAQALTQWLGCARWTWNWALELRRDAWESRHEQLTSVDLGKRLGPLYAELPWLAEPPTCVLQQKLRDLDKAWKAWDDGNGHAEEPVFKKRHDKQSIRFTLDARHRNTVLAWGECGTIVLPKLGALRVKGRSWPKGCMPKTVTVCLDRCGDWWVSFALDEPAPQWTPAPNWKAGLDWGAGERNALVADTGWVVEAPRPLAGLGRLDRRANLERKKARQVKGSRRYQRTRQRIARLSRRIARIRGDWLHKITTWLVKTFEIIGIEDLDVKGMSASARGSTVAPGRNVRQKAGLNRSILDSCPGLLRRLLEYKVQWYGRTLGTADRWSPTSKRCRRCGAVRKTLRLKERRWTCTACATTHDRDINAAGNMLGFPPGEPGTDLRGATGIRTPLAVKSAVPA